LRRGGAVLDRGESDTGSMEKSGEKRKRRWTEEANLRYLKSNKSGLYNRGGRHRMGLPSRSRTKSNTKVESPQPLWRRKKGRERGPGEEGGINFRHPTGIAPRAWGEIKKKKKKKYEPLASVSKPKLRGPRIPKGKTAGTRGRAGLFITEEKSSTIVRKGGRRMPARGATVAP